MPATRSPKKAQPTISFRKTKQTKRASSGKTGKKGKQEETPVEIPPLYSDHDTSDEEEEFEIGTPGGKLDEGRYKTYHRSLKRERGIAHPIHTQNQTKIHEILRIFDLSYEYGPCIGVTRLARWERAQKAGLNPPPQVKDILQTEEGQKDEALVHDVFYSEGV